MATIVDPDNLRLSSQASSGIPDGEVYVDPTTSPPTIELISTTEWAGSNFTNAEGVSLQALYSFLKEQWKTNATFIKYEFPMEAITAEQFEFINNWEPLNDTVRSYIRTGGWTEKDATGTAKQTWMGVITLGNIELSQTAYYAWFDPDAPAFLTSAANFTYSGPVNEAVKIFGDLTHGNFNYTTEQLYVYIRPNTTGGSGSVVGYSYNSSNTAAIGSAGGVTYQVYRFPLSTSVDLSLTLTDAEITSLETAKGLQITYGTPGTYASSILPIELQGGPYNFAVLINSTTGDGASLTPSEVYNWVQYKLRQDANIDTGASVNGKLAEALVTFVGPVLETFAIDGGTEGVLIDNINTGETANFKFRDDTNTLRPFPTVAAGKIAFNNNLINDPSTKYWMFYTTANAGANVYPGANALLVPDYNGVNITGDLHNVIATPATGSATDTDGSTTAGSFVLTSSLAGWTATDYDDKILVVTTGANAGYYNIVTNGTDSITVDSAFEATDAAMTFEVRNRNTLGEITWDFNYDSGATRGDGNASNPAPVSVVALGLDTAQYVSADFTIQGTSGQSFSIVAALERNYADPV